MQLYFSPFACSLASHITAREAGIDLALTAVTLATKRTAGGDDYLAIAPKGQVPALRLDDGSLLTEGAAVVQYLADHAADGTLLPPAGHPDRYAVLEWLTFVTTEIHKLCLYPYFSPEAPDAVKAWARALLDRKVDQVEARLTGREFVATPSFSIADAYMTWALHLCEFLGVDFTSRPATRSYLERMRSRPAVREAMTVERAAMPQPS